VSYDLVIRNGVVVDGTGLGSIRADVGVVGNRIATVGRIRDRGAEEIDAEGLVVTPGFIDVHTHMDAQIFWDPQGSNSCWHGVTTVVMGNCGFTLAPGSADQRALLVRNLERAEDMSARVLDAGIPWTWRSFGEYLDTVDAQPLGINYVSQVGHSAIRCHVMGERAFTDAATDDDLAAMTAHLREALAAGAWGFTTSRTIHHQTPDGGPVASRVATAAELELLVRAAGQAGNGSFQFVADKPTDPERLAAHDRALIELAAETGLTFVIGGSDADYVTGLLDEAAAAGARFVSVVHPRGIGNLSSFRTRTAFDALPSWQGVRGLPLDGQRHALSDPTVRECLVHEALNARYEATTGAEARPPDFDRMRVVATPTPPWPTVNEIAAARGTDPVSAIIDLALESDFEQFFVQAFAPFDHAAVERLLAHSRTVMGFSDAGAHVSQMADASITTHLLAHWVRDRQALSLERAVSMLTMEPARAWGIPDRGLVWEGMIADLNVFDPATVGPAMPSVVNDLPAGGVRIDQRSTGIAATVVGGTVAVRHGEHTGRYAGVVLRRRRR
jgi:N-acyl-D-amino-acid deacylase